MGSLIHLFSNCLKTFTNFLFHKLFAAVLFFRGSSLCSFPFVLYRLGHRSVKRTWTRGEARQTQLQTVKVPSRPGSPPAPRRDDVWCEHRISWRGLGGVGSGPGARQEGPQVKIQVLLRPTGRGSARRVVSGKNSPRFGAVTHTRLHTHRPLLIGEFPKSAK